MADAALASQLWNDPVVYQPSPTVLVATANDQALELRLRSDEQDLRLLPTLRRPVTVDEDGDIFITLTVHGRSGKSAPAIFEAEGSALRGRTVQMQLQVYPKATSLHRRPGQAPRSAGGPGRPAGRLPSTREESPAGSPRLSPVPTGPGPAALPPAPSDSAGLAEEPSAPDNTADSAGGQPTAVAPAALAPAAVSAAAAAYGLTFAGMPLVTGRLKRISGGIGKFSPEPMDAPPPKRVLLASAVAVAAETAPPALASQVGPQGETLPGESGPNP